MEKDQKKIEGISVIIPTYNNAEALDLCLKSCIEGQNEKQEIIVVCDGCYPLMEPILVKYKDDIVVLPLMTNMGLPKATNLGVYNSSNNNILIVNDDNVFPNNWDTILLEDFDYGVVLTPNQIEPISSMFKQFHIEDFGRTPSNFNMDEFNLFNIENQGIGCEENGSTLPIFMSKMDYLRVGGWDENFPTNGIVADWDFFLKCQLSGLEMRRTYNCHFYHFGSLTVNNKERQITEQEAHEYARYKWGSNINHESNRNLKYL